MLCEMRPPPTTHLISAWMVFAFTPRAFAFEYIDTRLAFNITLRAKPGRFLKSDVFKPPRERQISILFLYFNMSDNCKSGGCFRARSKTSDFNTSPLLENVRKLQIRSGGVSGMFSSAGEQLSLLIPLSYRI